MADSNDELTGLATDLTVAWLGNANNRAAADDVPAFLEAMYAALTKLAGEGAIPDDAAAEPAVMQFTPAVSVRKSLASKDHILSMIDGKPYKALRRHLAANGLTPDEYRQRYDLRPDYPMVAENYSASRSAMAKQIGLGRKAKAAAEELVPAPEAPKRGRRRSTPAA